jgi:protocatechuate 3,4-dioxygenase beta subunit
MRLLPLLLSCSVAVIGAQSPARDTPSIPLAAPAGTAALSGVVKDSDGQPLRRALVSIESDVRVARSAITDDDGRFSFGNLPAGRFTVSAEKGGYPSISYGAKRPGRAGSGVLLTDGQVVNDIALALARGGVLTGTVYDDRGQPLPGVPVQPWEVSTSLSGERTLAAINGNGLETDDRGIYRFYGLPPGEYTVGTTWFYSGVSGDVRVPTDAEIDAAFALINNPAAAPATQKAWDARNYNFARVYFPDALDPLAAATIHLSSGEDRDGVDLHMQLRPMSKIEGTIASVGADAGSIEMVLARRSRVGALSSTTFWSAKSDGTFATQSLGPGDYRIFARTHPPPGEPTMFASQDVTISGADPVALTLTLEPAMTLTGRVVFAGTALPPPPDLTQVRVTFFAPGSGLSNNNGAAKTDDTGAFSLDGITPGTFRLTAGAPVAPNSRPEQPRWTVASIVLDGRDITDLPIDVTSGMPLSTTVTFTDQYSELSGTVTTSPGQRASDFFVVVFPADRRYWQTQTRRIVSARPDASGRFVFRGLPAGDYCVAATTDLVPGDLGDAAALGALLSQSAPVTLTLGEKRTFDLKIGG